MFGRNQARTGIDLGTRSIKLLRGEGSPRIRRVSHAGIEDWEASGPEDIVTPAAEALSRLLDRLRLSKGRLGRIAVAIGGEGTSLREVVLPALKEDELRKALPFEAKRHLFLEGMESPIFDFQVLGRVPPEEEGGPEQMRVLLVAASKPKRDFPLKVLERVGLEPEIVELETLASVNALLADIASEKQDDGAVGLLNLGALSADLCMVHPEGGLLPRRLGDGPPREPSAQGLQDYASELTRRIQETLTFYRGRHRREAKGLYLCGGGALFPDLVDNLKKSLDLDVDILDPIGKLEKSKRTLEIVSEAGPRFVTALGLCLN